MNNSTNSNSNNSTKAAMVVSLTFGIAAVICILISMRDDCTYPFLTIGLALVATANIINCKFIKNRYNCPWKEKDTTSEE